MAGSSAVLTAGGSLLQHVKWLWLIQ